MEGCVVSSAVVERRVSIMAAPTARRISSVRKPSVPMGSQHRTQQGFFPQRKISVRQPFRVPSALFEDASDEESEDELDRLPRRIVINVSGVIFDAPIRMFARHPDTLLGNPMKRLKYYDPHTGQFHFDRDQCCAEAIIEYYQNGRLRRPAKIPLDLFLREVKFFQLSTQTILHFCDEEGHARLKPHRPPRNLALYHVWEFLMDPHSSKWAFAYAAFSMILIVVSIVIFCLETLPMFHHPHDESHHGQDSLSTSNHSAVFHGESSHHGKVPQLGYRKFLNPMFLTETGCVAWFTVELLLHFTVCPNKKWFIGSALNIIDLLAVVPFYIHVIVSVALIATEQVPDSHGFSLTVLHILHLVRVFRIFKLSQYSRGMRILGETFRTSFHELSLCLLFLGVGVLLFSSAMYYAETLHLPDSIASTPHHLHHETNFTSIPSAFYWTALTMTTVGYSGATPQTVAGKIVGSLCAVSGLIAVSLPVPIIVGNFQAIYERDKESHYIETILTAAIGVQYTSTSSFRV